MININVYKNGIRITGHDNNEPCARISTVFQLMLKLFKNKIKESEIKNGVSYATVDGLTKGEKINYELFIEYYSELQKLYPNMVRFNMEESNE